MKSGQTTLRLTLSQSTTAAALPLLPVVVHPPNQRDPTIVSGGAPPHQRDPTIVSGGVTNGSACTIGGTPSTIISTPSDVGGTVGQTEQTTWLSSNDGAAGESLTCWEPSQPTMTPTQW